MVNCERVCATCSHYLDPNSQYECQYWEWCTPERTCSEWTEGQWNHNLLYRIQKLEDKNARVYI